MLMKRRAKHPSMDSSLQKIRMVEGRRVGFQMFPLLVLSAD